MAKPIVLVIENELNILANLTRMLALEGFDAIGAKDGATGLELARERRPDLIICDVRMPEMTGDVVLAKLRADEAIAATPFVFLTASADETERQARLDAGADDYLIKPIDFRDLLAAIERQLAKRKA